MHSVQTPSAFFFPQKRKSTRYLQSRKRQVPYSSIFCFFCLCCGDFCSGCFGLLQGLGLLRCSAAIPPWQRQAVRLVLVAFCKRCLSCFPADFQILIMNRFVSCDRFGAMSTADAQHLHRVAGKASAGEVQLPLDEWSKGLLRKSSSSLQGAFGRTQSPHGAPAKLQNFVGKGGAAE